MLHYLKRLDILLTLYQDVWIPPIVLDELEANYPQFRNIISNQFPFLKERSPSDLALVTTLRQSLDPGESAAIALAIELHADILLMDEIDGRAIAKQRGLKTIGALGVLIQARQNGLIGPLRPLLDELENQLKFFMSQTLKELVLKSVGE